MQQYTGLIVILAIVILFAIFQPIDTGGKEGEKRALWILDKFYSLLSRLKGAGIKTYYIIRLLLRWTLLGLIIYFCKWRTLLILAVLALILSVFNADEQ